jgi:hypothetical protein
MARSRIGRDALTFHASFGSPGKTRTYNPRGTLRKAAEAFGSPGVWVAPASKFRMSDLRAGSAEGGRGFDPATALGVHHSTIQSDLATNVPESGTMRLHVGTGEP